MGASGENPDYMDLAKNLTDFIKQEGFKARKKYFERPYWLDSEFENELDAEPSDIFRKHLSFLGASNLERTLEIERLAGDMDWDELVDRIDYEISPKQAYVKCHEMIRRDLMSEHAEWSPGIEDSLDAYRYYERLHRGEEDFNHLVGASGARTAHEIFENYEEGDVLDGYEIEDITDFTWQTYYQHTLPRMDDAGLIDWATQSIDSEIAINPPFNLVKDFLGSMEAVAERHS